ncbi:hypothetical protein INS49_000201 [Diaporthe citri]|uniref:uncharacterized protein n=1 Tax=Diaporthe citri TaxID=83186 RepID=UPI001C81B0EC|nr:uncharacterized protein INS49_000201 [Diaporthe citri]KAG6366025.1 hypothetical protein INS49_000201 [Diaporthe citri]
MQILRTTRCPCVACLLIALQWGGVIYAWSDGRIIALLVLFSILVIVFVGVERWIGDDAMVPKRVVKQRSVIASVLFAFTNGGSCYLFAYYIPIWFQACKGSNPIQAGVNILPLVIAQTIASISCGLGVTATGYIWPFMTAASVFTAIGAGLLTTFQVDISNVVALEDIAIAFSLIMMMQAIGGSDFISLVQAVLANSLASDLVGAGLSEEQASDALAGGVTDVSNGLTGWLPESPGARRRQRFPDTRLVGPRCAHFCKEAKVAKDDEAAIEETKEGSNPVVAF